MHITHMGMTMLRLVQLRIAVGVFAAGILSLTVAAAWAFNLQNVSPGGGGNSTFTDPDDQLTDSNNHNSGQGVRPFGSNGPMLQFGIQQGPLTPFGRGGGYSSTPDPYYGSLRNGN